MSPKMIVASKESLLDLYARAYQYCAKRHPEEVDWVRKLNFSEVDADFFFKEFVWVVLNSGMKNKVAAKIFDRFMRTRNLDVIRHEQKRGAVTQAISHSAIWFEKVKDATDKITYIDTLPFMGPATSYHLARNIGLDYAKPDRHMMRIAQAFGFKDAQAVCEFISKERGDRVGVVDVILWRYLADGNNLNLLNPDQSALVSQ